MTLTVKVMTLKMKVKVIIMDRVLAPSTMHIWHEYGECSLNHSEAITITRCYDFEGQGYDPEDEGQGHSQ